MLSKNQKLSMKIESVDGLMNGVTHENGQAVFIPGALKGETVTVQIVKCAKSYAIAKLLSVDEKSALRVQPPCPYYEKCGGCSALHMTYETSLDIKREAVSQLLRRVGGVSADVPPVLGMRDPFHYRNKTAMPVGGTAQTPLTGFYSPRSHRLVPVEKCLISMGASDGIAAIVREWMRVWQIAPYDETTGRGLIRHVLSRVSRAGESMAVIVAAQENVPRTKELCELLKARVPGLVSVCLSVNTRGDNVILGPNYRTLYGVPRLQDTLCGFAFSLSPLSFFQINPIQTETLYNLALSFAAPGPDDLVADLYCGAGTISLLLAKHAGRVVGIELVPQAIDDARENARANGIDNVAFYAGEVETVLPKLVNDGLRPSIVVLDPPRKGVAASVLDAIQDAAPARVVYVSCDPATQARDIKILCEKGYHLERVQPVDMFCWTAHVETVVLLSKEHVDTMRNKAELSSEDRDLSELQPHAAFI